MVGETKGEMKGPEDDCYIIERLPSEQVMPLPGEPGCKML